MVAKKKTTRKAAAPKKAATKKTVAKKPVAVSGGWWGNSFTAAGALITISAFLAILAMFSPWLGDNISGLAVTYNGWDLLLVGADEKEAFLNNSWQVFIPLITFICAIVAFVAMVLPAFKLRTNRVATDVLVIILGLVMFLLAICFVFGETSNYGVVDGKFADYMLIGFYITIVPALLMVIAGLVDAVKNAKA